MAGLHHQRHLRRHRRAHQLHRAGRPAGQGHRDQRRPAQGLRLRISENKHPPANRAAGPALLLKRLRFVARPLPKRTPCLHRMVLAWGSFCIGGVF